MTSGNTSAVTNSLDAAILRRVTRATAFVAAELKKTVSIPAPRAVSKKTGRPYATAPATPGAPPRKLSGAGRASIAWVIDKVRRLGRVGVGRKYMAGHEAKGHPWVGPTLTRIRAGVSAILGGRQP